MIYIHIDMYCKRIQNVSIQLRIVITYNFVVS